MIKEKKSGAKTKDMLVVMTCILAVLHFGNPASAQEEQAREQRIEKLEKRLEKLQTEMQELKQEQSQTRGKETSSMSEKDIATLRKAADRLDDPATQRLLAADSWLQRFTLGGYGEIHANFNQGSDDDQFDFQSGLNMLTIFWKI